MGDGTGNENDAACAMHRYLQAMTKLGRFSGAVLVACEGKVIHSAGYGLADREHGVANAPHTKFRIGSITKQFTAMAILILEEQGKLNVRDPISKHLPYSPDSWREITIHHLLNHTSGLVRAAESLETVKLPLTVREAVETFLEKALEFKTGTQYQYANTGYILLGDIIERTSGVTYEEFLREHIFDPLEMVDSGYDSHNTVLPNRATGYRKENEEWVRSEYIDLWWAYAAGAIYSTVDDLYRWDQALLAERLISKESHARMTTMTPLLSTYGYGLAMGREHNRGTIGHAGGIHGFRSQFVRYPDEPACVIVLSNSEVSDFYGVATTLGAILFGEKYDVPPVKTPVQIAENVLVSYAGVYEILPGVTLRVSCEGGGLLITSDNVRRQFLPESETVFFREEGGEGITFHASEEGKVSHLTLRQAEVETEARKAPERSDTRLIIMEGIMGSGKSTTGQFLEGHLQSRGIPAQFLPEWVAPHPIRLDDALPHPFAPWADVTVEEYIERSRVRWRAFVKKRRFADTVTILDGQFFHGDLTNLFMMDASREQCERHIEQIIQMTAPLRPAVIYLAARDVPRALGVVFQARGEKWEKYQVDWKTQSPYCQQRGLSGQDGLVQMYLDYRALTDDLFAALPMKKLRIDPSDGEWPRYQERIQTFLAAATSRGTAERRKDDENSEPGGTGR